MESKTGDRLHRTVLATAGKNVCELLQAATGLSKGRIKDAMLKGAVWLKRPCHKEKRLRRATAELLPNDRIDLFYDPEVLALTPPTPQILAEDNHYSVWYKPSGLLTQGTRYGDHCSLTRCAELFFQCRKEIRPVHRLDREAFGLVLLAHTRQGAAALSRFFREGEIEKRYRAVVEGIMGTIGASLTFSEPLDGKTAVTKATVLGYSADRSNTTLDIRLHTGRFHQIRRHLSHAGYPIVGDPRYGIREKGADTPLQLCAYALKFQCPFNKTMRTFSISETTDNGMPPRELVGMETGARLSCPR